MAQRAHQVYENRSLFQKLKSYSHTRARLSAQHGNAERTLSFLEK